MQHPNHSQKKIIFLMPYFGRWPEWFPFYLESCRWNPTIDWLFFTDCPIPENAPANVRFISISYPDYQQFVSERLGIAFKPESSYKLIDVRPAFGFIHQEYLAGYDYFGFGDVDIIYGDLRAFYTDDVLRYNTLSTHYDRVSGHHFLIKNQERWINIYQRIPNWQQLISNPQNQGVDEYWFTKVLRGHRLLPPLLCNLWGVFDPDKRNHLFMERFTTVFAERPWVDGSYNYPTKWYWYQGKLTTEFGGEFIYLHFMNWKSSRYLRKWYGQQAAWETLPQLIDPALTDLTQGWCISALGFTPLSANQREIFDYSCCSYLQKQGRFYENWHNRTNYWLRCLGLYLKDRRLYS